MRDEGWCKLSVADDRVTGSAYLSVLVLWVLRAPGGPGFLRSLRTKGLRGHITSIQYTSIRMLSMTQQDADHYMALRYDELGRVRNQQRSASLRITSTYDYSPSASELVPPSSAVSYSSSSPSSEPSHGLKSPESLSAPSPLPYLTLLLRLLTCVLRLGIDVGTAKPPGVFKAVG